MGRHRNRSPSPRGRIREIRFGTGVDWSEFVMVDHRDIPGRNSVHLIEDDQPVLASDHVRHLHEPVVLLAHPSRDEVRRAVRQVEVLVEPEPPALDFRATPAPDQIQYGGDNVLKRLHIEKGDVERALAEAPVVVEGVYETGAQEHLYLEPQGMLAWEKDGVVTVAGSMQCPYFVLMPFASPSGGKPEADPGRPGALPAAASEGRRSSPPGRGARSSSGLEIRPAREVGL